METLTSPRHREMLAGFASSLAGEGFGVEIVPAAGDIPYDVLLVALAPEGEGDGRQLELSFLPGLEEQLAGASLLQCFVALPAEVAAEAELERLIARINAQLPLVGFGFWRERRLPCFRHILMLPDEPGTAASLVVQAAWMISYLLSLFAESVADVARGHFKTEDALARGPFAHVFR